MSRRLHVVLIALAVVAGGCGLIQTRAAITEEEARAFLDRAVQLVEGGDSDDVCQLSPFEATTCPDTILNASGVVPDTPPSVRCAVELPDEGPLRRGIVLVVDGSDGIGDPYLTEFIVFDDGDDIGVLDAVYWSGLSVQSYSEDTVSWRFDSASQACDRQGLPRGDPPDAGTPAPVPADPGSDTSTD